jgi:putative FmdB family regulatory protein
MPLYDYQCSNKKCAHEFEVFYSTQSAVQREEQNEKCPQCGGKRKKKLVSKGTGFVLKGSGWHSKDYKK